MSPVLNADGEKTHWINYKTGERDLYFRMNADNKTAYISIELTHKDAGMRELFFEQLVQLKDLLHASLREEWIWQWQHCQQDGKIVSRVYTQMNGVSIFRRDDWPQLISFFKPRMVALDAFWSTARYHFEAMR